MHMIRSGSRARRGWVAVAAAVGLAASAGAAYDGGTTTPAATTPAATPAAVTVAGAQAAGVRAAAADCAPVNPAATTPAKNLLCYVYSQYGNHIISGQEESTWVAGSEYEMNYIQSNTGKLPAIRGMDFEQSGVAGRAISWWNAGGIPMIGYHMGAPTKPDTYEGSQMAVSINAVLSTGTAEHTSFLSRLDAVAAQLQQMQDADIAVLWRPFHEAGGTWFWWSKEGGAQYNRLWNFTYDYFTNTKKLNNLIWLHPYNGQPQSSFYPGRATVDIGGADTYAGDHGPLTSMFNTTKNIYGGTIPIALHENGRIPDPDQLQSTGTPWVLFNTWHTSWLTDTSYNSVAELKKTFTHAYVVTRDEVPDLG